MIFFDFGRFLNRAVLIMTGFNVVIADDELTELVFPAVFRSLFSGRVIV